MNLNETITYLMLKGVFFYVEMSLCRLHVSDILVGELILTQMSVTSFLTRCRQLSPWQEMGLEIEGEELVHTVRQNCFFFFFFLIGYYHTVMDAILS